MAALVPGHLWRLLAAEARVALTPAQFVATYGGTADAVSHGTGIDREVLLAQWGVETAWGSAIFNSCNLGNIRCLQGVPCARGFSQFPNLSSFIVNCVATWHNGKYAAVLAAATPADQLLAIGLSPWDAGHYNNGGGPGSSLIAAYGEIHVSDFTAADRTVLQSIHDRLSTAVPGTLDDQIKAACTAALQGTSGTGLTPAQIASISASVTAAVVAAIKGLSFKAA